MSLRTHLLAGTAAVLTAFSAGAVLAESHEMATHPETGETLAAEQIFVYRILDEHSSLDPGLVEDVTGSEVARDLFEGLYSQDGDGNIVPGVALDHEVSEDGLVYTFNLRPEAVWSNGEPVKASDFVYAWKRAADPALASPYAWYMELMSIANAAEIIAGEKEPDELGVKALDDHRLEVTLTTALPYFPQMVTHSTTFPVPQAVVEEFGTEWTKPENMVSNGAYILKEHVPQERSVRVRNEKYWDNENTILEEVTALVINDENVALTRYLAGELDRTEVPAGQFPRLSEEYPDQAIVFPRLCSYYYTFNLREGSPEWEHDVNVRKALSMAVDRNVITENVTAAGQIPAYNFTPEATANFVMPEIEAASLSQDERNEMAKELLTEAGYGPDNPLKVTITYNTDEAHRAVAVAISQMWKQVLGVEAELANQEWQTFLEARDNGDFEIARAGWCGDYNEASTFLDLMQTDSGYNDAKYSNEEVDSLLKEAKTSVDPNALYTQVEQIVSQDVPLIPIYHYVEDYMMNAQLIPSWPVNNVEQNWYSKDLYFVAEE